jgi:hypothetical protein
VRRCGRSTAFRYLAQESLMLIPMMILTSFVAAVLSFAAGWWCRARRARREDAQHAMIMCGFLVSLREGTDESKLDALRECLTLQARAHHGIWQEYGGVMPEGSGALYDSFRKAHGEFADRAAA